VASRLREALATVLRQDGGRESAADAASASAFFSMTALMPKSFSPLSTRPSTRPKRRGATASDEKPPTKEKGCRPILERSRDGSPQGRWRGAPKGLPW
jgi:hypothetical protein